MTKSKKENMLSAEDEAKAQALEIEDQGQLNHVVKVITRRPNGTVRIQQDFKFCPTMAEQHTAHLTDVNYLMEKFKPDELQQYLMARMHSRPEITNHDFSAEPNLQEAKNIVLRLQKNYDDLPEDIKVHFKSHVEFLKFIDNPENQVKMKKLGLMTQEEIQKHLTTTPTTKHEEETTKEGSKTSSSAPKGEDANSSPS